MACCCSGPDWMRRHRLPLICWPQCSAVLDLYLGITIPEFAVNRNGGTREGTPRLVFGQYQEQRCNWNNIESALGGAVPSETEIRSSTDVSEIEFDT